MRPILLIFVASLMTATTPGQRQARPAPAAAAVRQYLSADTREAALGLLAEDYRLWFGEKKGEPMRKDEAARVLEWDYALRPRRRIRWLRVSGRTVVVGAHEDNDFSLLLDFPGWDAVSTFEIDRAGKISSQTYLPARGQPEWKPYLEKALPWLRARRPDVLARIYPGNRLARTTEAAREWVRVLREWRAATGRPDPFRPPRANRGGGAGVRSRAARVSRPHTRPRSSRTFVRHRLTGLAPRRAGRENLQRSKL